MSKFRKLAKGALSAASVATQPPYVPAGHFYSPLTSRADRERAVAWSLDRNGASLPGVEYSEEDGLSLGHDMARLWPDMVRDGRYRCDEMYGLADAAIYYALLRMSKPARLIEIGSGYSTAVALDTIEAFGLSTSVTCIEPNATRLRSLLKPEDRVSIIELPVQEIPLARFAELEPGDFLFIDSTHVAKPGSDVVYDFLRILPVLAPGVMVHIHDIAWPFEYNEAWLRERRDWNEVYLVHAFLLYNKDWRIRFFADHIWPSLHSTVRQNLPGAEDLRPGALWIERV